MPKKSHKYTKDGTTVLWQPGKCIHSGVCARGLSAVFNPARIPWIDMSKAEINRIIEQVNNCPSRALSIVE